VATVTAAAKATVITATRAMTKTTTRIGKRRRGRERDLRINGVAIYYKLTVIMVGRFLVPIRRHTGVSHLLSYLRSHQKRNAQFSISDGTQNVQKMC
jgi:hypothetical protein